jgi:hypothetical protein
MKDFKVTLRVKEEITAENSDEALKTACKTILRNIGVANVNDDVVAAMSDYFVYTITGKKSE